MKVAFDIRMAGHSGIGTTVRELLTNLSEPQKQNIILFGPRSLNAQFQGHKHFECNAPIYSLRQQWEIPRILKKIQPDILHIPHFDVPLFYKGPLIATVHDLIHILFPKYSQKPFSKPYALKMLKHINKHARRILVVSNNTKKDLLTIFPEAESRIRVIHPSVSANFQPNRDTSNLNILGVQTPYYLYVGNLRASKNTPFLIQTYKDLLKSNPELPDLVLAGKNFLPNKAVKYLPKKIKILGPVSSNVLPALYASAEAFIYPSLYDGFGLPPLEAMACGTPVLCSKAASLPEVCGDAAIYFDPNNEKDLAQAILNFHHSTDKYQVLKKRGFENIRRFSWSDFARKTFHEYEMVFQELKS